ncbi:inorganic phosphate transporter [candidate division WOR-3 bacterium]|nr:inorganic phosphate transporter [candidate division WOR-3 bacterium]
MSVIVFLALASGFIVAFAIGANDVANSMATAVGAKAITIKQAVLIAAVLEFSGAFFFGKMVTETICKGIVPMTNFSSPEILIAGAFAAILASAIFILAATRFDMPISTTHSIIGGLIGFGLVAGGVKSVSWMKVLVIVFSWIISPVLGAILSYTVFKILSIIILRKDDPFNWTKKTAPFIIGFTFLTISWLFTVKTLSKGVLFAFVTALLIAITTTILSFLLLRIVKFEKNEEYSVEKIFRKMQILTSCYVSFAHGANDVANAIGPIAIILMVAKSGVIACSLPVTVDKSILALGGIGIALGVALLGYRVMRTIGEKITSLNNTRGFTIDISVATSVIIASFFGLPVSSTHTVVGAVVGVGYARGFGAVNFGIIRRILISWLLTVPAAALLSALLYKLLLLNLITKLLL